MRPAGSRAAWLDGEQHFRLEDEAVADDADARPVAEDLAQAAEEIGAVTGELLHLLRESDIEARAEIGDFRLRFDVRFLRGVERLLDGGELAAQRRDLLI